MNSLEKIILAGFAPIGRWVVVNGELTLELNQLGMARNVLYAFVMGDAVKYVGKTAQALSQRMYGYQKPGPTQRTNVRVRGEMIECLRSGGEVMIYAFADNGQTHYGGFHVNFAAALEDDLVAKLQPEWNLAGKKPKGETRPNRKVDNIIDHSPVIVSTGDCSVADNVRQYAYEHYIVPAMKLGQTHVEIRAGDVHRDLGFKDRRPLVCAALGGKLFEKERGVQLVSRRGPKQGANVYFTFRIIL